MGLVFINIKNDMLNLASAALLATASEMTKDEFFALNHINLPSPDAVTIALTAIMENILNCTDKNPEPFINILNQVILNMKRQEGPRR
jgi:hypothetical protein